MKKKKHSFTAWTTADHAVDDTFHCDKVNGVFRFTAWAKKTKKQVLGFGEKVKKIRITVEEV